MGMGTLYLSLIHIYGTERVVLSVDAGIEEGMQVTPVEDVYKRQQSFHRCSTGGVCRLFLYCSDRNDDDSSGPYDRTDYWRVADV